MVAVVIYKETGGRKLVGLASDGSIEGRARIFEILKQDFAGGRAWMEVSGPLETLLVKRFDALAYAMPNDRIADFLGKPVEALDPDGFHYVRIVNGERKLLLKP